MKYLINTSYIVIGFYIGCKIIECIEAKNE